MVLEGIMACQTLVSASIITAVTLVPCFFAEPMLTQGERNFNGCWQPSSNCGVSSLILACQLLWLHWDSGFWHFDDVTEFAHPSTSKFLPDRYVIFQADLARIVHLLTSVQQVLLSNLFVRRTIP